MRFFVGAIVALTFVAGATPAIAVQAPTEQSPPSGGDSEALFKEYDKQLFSRHYKEALAIVDKLDVKSSDPEIRAIVGSMRVAPLLGLKRNREAEALIAEIRKSPSRDPFPTNLILLGGLLAERYDVASEALDDFIARYPDALRELEPSLVYDVLRNAPKGQEGLADDRRVSLARIGFGGDRGDFLTAEAVAILLARGDKAGAADLLKFIDEPRVVEDLLIQRRYAAIWPQLEEMAGPHLEKVRASSTAAAERALARKPEDHEALADLANALRHSGRLDDAIKLKSRLPAKAQMSSADEQVGWLVNNIALAMHEAGRADEADALFADLNEAPMPKEFWRVSMKINRLELLVFDGKFDRALPLIEPTAKTEGSDYAEQLVRRLRYCTYSRLGRTSEAALLEGDLLAHAKDAPAPTIDGLLCAGQIDKAEKLALASLKNADEAKRRSFEGDFVRQLQVKPLTSDDPSVWEGKWQDLRRRPAIAAEFERLGRDMPDAYLVPKTRI